MPVRHRRLFWIGMLFILVSSTAFALVSLRPIPAAASKPTQDSNNRRLEAELITLHPTGFEPSEINRPAGPFILSFQNRSGLEQLRLRIDKSSGPSVREVQSHREKSDWSDMIELPVGSYTVTEVNNPEWVLRLNITPR